MAVNLPISDWIEWAKITQYLVADGNATKRIFNSGRLSKNWPPVIRLVRKLVEVAYARNPDDPTLYVTGPYLRSLIYEAAIAVAGGGDTPCISPIIATQPETQGVDEGDDVTLSVVATGSNLTYQWYKNDVLMSGETSDALEIENFEEADEGTYHVVVSNGCGTAVSNDAALSLNPAELEGFFWFGASDPYPALNGGTDDLVYQLTFPIINGDPLNVTPLPAGSAEFVFNVTKYPTSQGLKTTYENSGFISGTIGDATYRNIVTIGSCYYIISRTEIALEVSNPLTFE